MIELAEHDGVTHFSQQMVKHLLVTAQARPQGLTVPVCKVGTTDLGYIQPTQVVGDIVIVKVEEDYIAFATEHNGKTTSFITTGKGSKDSFNEWLGRANAYAPSGKDYGAGPGETTLFRRSV